MATSLRSLLHRLAFALLVLVPTHALAVDGPVMGNPPPELLQRHWEPPVLPEQWETVGGPAVHVHGHFDDDRLLVDLSRHADEAVPRLARELGIPIGGDVHIFLARTIEQFRELQPGRPPQWADGTAYPALGAIYLRHPSLRGGGARPLEQVLDHELIHVLLGRAFHPVEVPRWLQEGVAQVYAKEVGPDLPERISRGAFAGSLFRLAQLEHGFPAHAGRADLAYAQSADFVQWFRAIWGDDAVSALVLHARQGHSLDHAIHAITGQPLEEVDATWRARLEASTSLITGAGGLEGILFGAGGAALLVVGFLRRRALARRLASWRRDERALDRLAREVVISRRDDSQP